MEKFEGISLQSRWGDSKIDPTLNELKHTLDELKIDDEEHPDVWIENDYEDVLLVNQKFEVELFNYEKPENKIELLTSDLDQILSLWILFCENKMDELYKELGK